MALSHSMDKIRKICICGGGSLGLVCAGVFLSKGIKVSILSGHPKKWNKRIIVYDSNGKEYSGELENITADYQGAVDGADIVLLTVPGFLIERTLETIKPFLESSTIVGGIVSSTGFFFAAHRILNTSQPLFGFQRVPYIARQSEYGKSGRILGYKESLSVCVENISDRNDFRNFLEWLFSTPVRLLDNFYEASLTNSNPILHTGRLYSMWKDYNGEVYPEQIKFYSEWTDEASELLIKMDEEFQSLLISLGIREGVIPTLLDYYESADAPALTRKIRSIPAFQAIESPMIKTESGWIPDFTSRYFTEDFPYGLRFIKELADSHGIAVPNIDKVLEWGMSCINCPDSDKG